jgi:alcohol dehydrogenase (cytochrome c)
LEPTEGANYLSILIHMSFATKVVLIIVGVLAFVCCTSVIFLLSVPRYRWRLEIIQLKATGALPDITWKELWHLNRHGDPFNLKELVKNPNPYIAISDPFNSHEDLSQAETLFQANCSICHGAGGVGGGAGPALRQRQMQHGSSDWAMFQTISNGVTGTSMPASTLPENDRWRLVAYVKSLAQGPENQAKSELSERLAHIKPVSYADILAADQEAQRWLTYSGSYDGHRFSLNDQITPANVSNLRLLWMRQYTTSEIHIETSPLVIDGFMFVTVPPNRVEALDAKTGELIWHYDRELPQPLSLCCGLVNRGLAVLGNTLYLGTLDAHLVALDIKTGRVSWDVEIADYKAGYSITSAPLALKNMVITGVAGGEFGIRGFVDARDATTGKEIWRFNTIPQPGQPGAETWEGDGWKTGGGPTWLTGTFDPELNVIYWPVGNPSPVYSGGARKGDDLYTNSVVALNADDGKRRWHFQFTPHDLYDFDATEILVLFDKKEAGRDERLLAQADRNGFYYVLNRETGHFLSARQFAKQNWASQIDNNGRAIMNPAAVPSPKGALVYPSNGGATNWMSPSYDPITELMYVPAKDWGGNYFSRNDDYRPGKTFIGGFFQLTTWPVPGAVRALDVSTGELKWEYRCVAYNMGGILSTKGGVVFGSAEHFFFAIDAKTGRELWRINAGGPIIAAPVTYLNEGKEFVTIAAGHDLLTFGF